MRVAERTALIVTSDHGEDLFEHAYGDHGLLYGTVLSVPLIWVDPDLPTRVRQIDSVVQGIDLAPSILGRAGIPIDADMEGQSLLSLMGMGECVYPERPVFSMTDACNLLLRKDGWKLIMRDRTPPVDRAWLASFTDGDGSTATDLEAFLAQRALDDLPLPDSRTEREAFSAIGMTGTIVEPSGGQVPGVGAGDSLLELYDLTADPLEHHDLAAADPDRVESMLLELLEAAAARTASAGNAEGGGLTEEQVQILKDQGYWGFVQPRETPDAGPAPAGPPPRRRPGPSPPRGDRRKGR